MCLHWTTWVIKLNGRAIKFSFEKELHRDNRCELSEEKDVLFLTLYLKDPCRYAWENVGINCLVPWYIFHVRVLWTSFNSKRCVFNENLHPLIGWHGRVVKSIEFKFWWLNHRMVGFKSWSWHLWPWARCSTKPFIFLPRGIKICTCEGRGWYCVWKSLWSATVAQGCIPHRELGTITRILLAHWSGY